MALAAFLALPALAQGAAWVTGPADLGNAADANVASDAAVSGDGDSFVVWQRNDGQGHFFVEGAIRPAGGSYSARIPLSQESKRFSARVATGGQGNAVAVWAENAIHAAVRSPGGSFIPLDAPLSHPFYSADWPRVQIAPDGTVLVVWIRVGNLEGAIRAPGASEFQPLTMPATSQAAETELAIDPAGDAIVVWRETGGGGVFVRGSYRPAGGSFQAPFQIDAAQESTACPEGSPSESSFSTPQVAMDAQGSAAFAWGKSVTRPTCIAFQNDRDMIARARARDPGAGGALSPAATLDTGHTSSAALSTFVSVPVIALDGAGRAVAVWNVDDPFNPSVVRIASMPAHGAFGSKADLIGGSGDTDASGPDLATLADGRLALVFSHGSRVQAMLSPAGGAFGSPQDLSVSSLIAAGATVGADARGDAVAAWTLFDGASKSHVQATSYDGTPPELRDLQVPGAAVVGAPFDLSVGPFDAFSPVDVRWEIDGAPAGTGPSVGYTFDHASSHTARVSETDAAGNSASQSRTIEVSEPTGGSPGAAGPGAVGAGASAGTVADRTAPTVAGFRLRAARFAVGTQPTALIASTKALPRGTAFVYALSEAARATIAIKHRVRGRRSGRRCRPGTAPRKAKRCTVTVTVGTLTRRDPSGPNTTPFSGRLGKRALRPGGYQAVIEARDAAGNASRAATTSFVVVRATRKRGRR